MNLNQQKNYAMNIYNLINTLKKEQGIDTGEKYP